VVERECSEQSFPYLLDTQFHLRRASSVGKSVFFQIRPRSSGSPPRAAPPLASGDGLEVPWRLLLPEENPARASPRVA
jgi:hypothetical protein